LTSSSTKDGVLASVALGDPRKASLHTDRKAVDDIAQMHPGEPAADVGMLREHQPDR
jgi:hypothetical protein